VGSLHWSGDLRGNGSEFLIPLILKEGGRRISFTPFPFLPLSLRYNFKRGGYSMFKGKLFCLILLSIISFPSIVKAENKIVEEIEKIGQLLKEEESLRQKEKEQAVSTRKSLEERIKVLGEQIEGIKKENNKLRKETRKIESIKKNLIKKKKEEKIDFLLSDVRKLLSEKAERLQKKIEQGFPYLLEDRLEKVDSFLKRVEKEENLLESSRELWRYFLKEIDLGHNSEIYSEEIETEKGEIKKAKFLRVGRIFLAYRTNDGKETSRSFKSEDGYKWKRNLCRDCRKNLKKAIEMMEGRRKPHLLEFCIKFRGDSDE
jgi:hypothetical protein